MYQRTKMLKIYSMVTGKSQDQVFCQISFSLVSKLNFLFLYPIMQIILILGNMVCKLVAAGVKSMIRVL
jgi:hypothetical protein